ncbi:MAG TPA: hypothetical protein PLS88_04455 [Rectinema sp.]|jgi:hypothetical protein|nr:hypothetical protein [Spirochaetota bacterium]NLH88733.1 hypothetical protein [Treponema sp.]HNV36697.1 hypothetical protein [Rectinema sp.]HOC27854.1 hypothetical protein [Rectinema sp.]HOU06629.1 hypothetical protein [Rectinema sp.]
MTEMERRLKKIETAGLNASAAAALYQKFRNAKDPKRRERLYNAYLAADPARKCEKSAEIIEKRVRMWQSRDRSVDEKLIANSDWRIIGDGKEGK